MKVQGDFHSSLVLKQNMELQRRVEEQGAQMQQLTEQFQQISSEFENGCQQRIANLGAEKQALQAEVTQLRQNLGDKNQMLQAEVTQLRQNLGEENQVLKAEITQLREEQGALLKQLHEMKEQIKHQQGTASVLERELVQQSELCKKEKQTLTSQVQTLGKLQQGVTDGLRQEIQALKQDVCYVETCITPIPPFPFTVNRYSERMNSKEVFISSPFYTHHRGYKMTIRVAVNGSKGHVSVFCCIMRGEHDDSLKWPFHGDVCIRLLDHTDSQNHFEKLIRFDQRTPLSCSGKVTSGDKGFLHGYDNFIAHKDLNSVKNTQYIEGDALDFEVTSVTVANVM